MTKSITRACDDKAFEIALLIIATIAGVLQANLPFTPDVWVFWFSLMLCPLAAKFPEKLSVDLLCFALIGMMLGVIFRFIGEIAYFVSMFIN
jgi:hypothetical protein